MNALRSCLVLACLLVLTGCAGATTLPAVAGFTANDTLGMVPLPVQFTDQSDYASSWAWYFGDEAYASPWTEVNASGGWMARNGFCSVVLANGHIILAGGADSSTRLMNDTWRSTDNGAHWSLVNASSGWTARFNHQCVVLTGSSIVLTGGQDDSITWKNDVWRSEDDGITWSLVNASAGWPGRDFHSMVTLPDGSIVLAGGYGGGSTWMNDTWRSTDKGITWKRQTAAAAWVARAWPSSVAMPDGSIVLMGGVGNGYRNDTWQSTDKGATWNRVNASAGWSGRYGHSSVVMPDGSIVLMGGYDNIYPPYRNDTWRSTDKGATWTRIDAGADWPSRAWHSSVAMPDGSVVLVGGSGGGGVTYFNDTWQFRPAGSMLKDPVHTYTAPGRYTVVQRVSNAISYATSQKEAYIRAVLPDRVGVFRNLTHTFYLDKSGNGAWGSGDKTFSFGNTGDIPVSGDWNSDGYTEIGVFRNSTHTFYLDKTGNGKWGSGDASSSFGNTGDLPVAGYWNGDGTPGIGVYRPSTHTFYLDKSGNGKWGSGDVTYTFGNAGDLPVAGDWNGDGTTRIGVYRSSTHTFYLDTTGNGAWGSGDSTYTFGNTGDLPVAGDWNGDGTTEIGVYRSPAHTFYLDKSGNGAWGSGDTTYTFGNTGDSPVAGVWG